MAKQYVILNVISGEYVPNSIHERWIFSRKQTAESMIGWITVQCPEFRNNYEVIELACVIG